MRGILEMREIPQNLRQWEQFLRDINSLIKVSSSPVGVAVNLVDGSVLISYLEPIDTGKILGRTAVGTGQVTELSASQVAALIQSSVDHGSISGLGDDDHTQYVLRSILTSNGDLFVRAAGAVARLGVGSAGQVLSVNAGAPAWTSQDGIYTPTLTGVANVAASSAFSSQYSRAGNAVSVSGRLSVTATAGATLTQVGISLPIASALANQNECAGTGAAVAVLQCGGIDADVTNDRAQLNFISADTSARVMMYHFQYRVI